MKKQKQYTLQDLQAMGLTVSELTCFQAIDHIVKQDEVCTTAGIIQNTGKKRGWVWDMCNRLKEYGLIDISQPGVQVPLGEIVRRKAKAAV